MLCLQAFEGIFECVFLILPYKPPKGQNPFKGARKTLLSNPSATTKEGTWEHLGPILVQIGPNFGRVALERT